MLTKSQSQQDYFYNFFADKEDLLKAIDSIKLINCPRVKYSFGFSSPYTLQFFINVLNRQSLEEQTAQGFKLAYYDTQKGRFTRLKFRKDQSFTQVVRIKFYSTLRLIVFMKIYAQRIKKMESQYQYQLIPGKQGNLLIYMKQKNISNMFRNQLSQMKKILSCLQVRNQVYCQKVIYSKKFDQIFQKDQIKLQLWYKQKCPCIVFYTFNMKQSKLKNLILSKLQYHMTIMKFIDYKSSYLINCIFFRLMQGKIHQAIIDIKNEFDMEIQFNEDKCAIIIHDIDIVFQKQVKCSLLNSLSPLIFLSIKDRNIRNVSNFLKRKPDQFSQISTCFYKETLYLCFDKNCLNKSTLKKLFYKVAQFLSLQSSIMFSWFHLKQDQHQKLRQQITQNICNAVQNSPFIIQNFKSLANDGDARAIFKLKHFDQNDKNFQSNQIVNVLIDSIYKNSKTPIKIIQSSSSGSDSNYSIQQNSSSLSQNNEKKQINSPISEKSSNQSIQEPFQLMQPEIIQMNQELVWKVSRRDRQLQDRFVQYYLKSAKIWKLQLNSKHCHNLKQKGKIAYCNHNSLKSSLVIKKQELVDIKNCQNTQLLVGFYQVEQSVFVPIYLLKLISESNLSFLNQ